jgi:LmbE family N-acetylglucosaminyl deacetylase
LVFVKLLLSPHDDDNALFAAFTCMRERPLVIVCLDSHIQPNRGELGCSPIQRAAETKAAAEVLGVDIFRLGLSDATATEATIEAQLLAGFSSTNDIVYAPAEQGGNIHHDMIARVARRVFGRHVVEYTTYTKTELWTRGEAEVIPTDAELQRKHHALGFYESQIRVNRPHFDAVLGKSEWLNFPNK